MENKFKIAFISAVPFYYQVPFYRRLTQLPEIALTVYFCSNETITKSAVKKNYLSEGEFTKENLLEGYDYKFLKNYSLIPSYLHGFFGLMNLGIFSEIKNGGHDAVVLQAWNNVTWILAFLACLIFRKKIYFMTDSNILEEAKKSKVKRLFKKVFLGNLLFKMSNGFLISGKSNKMFYKSYGVKEKKMINFAFSWGYDDIIKKAESLLPKRGKLRKILQLEDTDFVILYVGRFSKEKSVATMIEAYKKMSGNNKKLFLVGSGPEGKMLKNKVESENIKGVHFFGFKSREEVFNFYALSDLLVLPSMRETWGIAVSEAMCFGLPIIVSDNVGSGPDLVESGSNGFIFESGSAQSLLLVLNQMITMKDDERKMLGRKSQEILGSWIKKLNDINQIKLLING